ncbi:hypothetical protein KEM52_006278, partial [Ascosphaera acerosa]
MTTSAETTPSASASATSQCSVEDSLLLRLRKHRASGAETPTALAWRAFATHLRPLFGPADLVRACLVRVPAPLVAQANAALRAADADATRPRNRRGTPSWRLKGRVMACLEL